MRWKDIPGYEGLYQVSDQGKVRSLGRLNAYGRRIKGRELSQINATRGYLQVKLCKDGLQSTRKIHVLVASAFIGDRPDGNHVRHLNGIKKDNRVVNLAYGSPAENGKDMRRHLTLAGENHSQSKLSEKDVVTIRKSDIPRNQLADKYGVTYATITDVQLGRSWRHI